MSINLFAATSLLIRIISMVILISYIVPKQLSEVWRPKDWLTLLRWYILLLLIFSIVASLPTIWYLFFRLIGLPSSLVQNIASICGSISVLCTSVLLVLIYNYKQKD